MKPKEFDLKQRIKNSYEVKVPDYWDRIVNSDILRVPKIEKKKGKILSFYRIAAGAACLVLIVVVSVFSLPHLFGGGSEQPGIIYGQDTPVRIGQMGSMKPLMLHAYTFGEAFEKADLVVEVVITEWLGELDKEGLSETTYLKAIILDELKNNLDLQKKEIVIMQSGNSKWTYKGYPLFKNGDRLLLPLLYADPVEYSAFVIKGEECFGIIGSQLTELQVVEKGGKKFALKRNLFHNFTDIENLMCPNATDIIEEALRHDEVLSQAGTVFECVYSVDDLKNYMDNLRKE